MIPDKKSLLKRAGEVLEWPAILSHLADRAVSEMGAQACRDLNPASGIEAVKRSLAETTEMARLLADGGVVPIGSFEDLRPVIERAEKGAVPTTEELAQVSSMLELARMLRGFFKNLRDEAPLLWERASALDERIEVKRAIDTAIDRSGKLKENASPELKRLTQSVRDRKANILSRIEEYMRSEAVSPFMQDEFYTQRGSRYVLPVKAEFRSKVEGIVHDSSNSGQTLFIEPRPFIEANNDLKMAEMAVEQEAIRILRELAGKVGESAPILAADLEILTEIDVIYAKGRMSIDLDASEPEINPAKSGAGGKVDLKAARHPLLALSGEVVSNDISFPGELAALIISGPNTGGKTVTLKMLGLFALMTRAGMHIPVERGGIMAVFPEVYADIGDEQDIGRHISTFSGHVLNIIGIIEAASAGALVLLDELVTSTDPSEGSAIAEAVLTRLADKGVKIIATTHYSQLKAYAQAQPRFANASVEFDTKTLTPTYRLVMGIPGRSSAIEIAHRLGMHQAVIDRATELIGSADRRIEEMLTGLERQKRNLIEETREAELQKDTARKLAEQQETALGELRKKEREFKSTLRSRISSEVESARRQVQEVLQSLTRERTRKQALDSRKKLREIEGRYREGVLMEGEKTEPENLREGDVVVVAHLGTAGVLMEDVVAGGEIKPKVKVRIGRVPMVVPTDSLRIDPTGYIEKEQASGTSYPSRRSSPDAGETDSAGTRLDLRGFRAEDAVDEVERFLDKAALAQFGEVEIIHGHGTGALKKAVREYLDRSPYVNQWRPADLKFGGDGVTIVEMKT